MRPGKFFNLLLITGIIISFSKSLFSQEISPANNTIMPYFTYGKGLGITSPDSLFKLNIRFRMQNRLAITNLTNFDQAAIEARIRRFRLRLDGFVYTPKLTYVIQLGFSRADMNDGSGSTDSNIIRDAMIVYKFNHKFSIGFGQTKLPGNRQFVISSGDQQFVDRSITNAIFNIDRDFGMQISFSNSINNFNYNLKGAITTGEGPNAIVSSTGLAYTGRIELLPFGPFKDGGDYFESDLAREPKPKVSVGVTLSDDLNAIRTGGESGFFLYENRDIFSSMVDLLYKHNGWAFSSEFIQRNTDDPITQNEAGDIRFVYKGHGENYQLGYLFKKNYELAVRYSHVMPNDEIQTLVPNQNEYTLGASKYIKGHRLKLQTDGSYLHSSWLQGTISDRDTWQWRFQIELGI